MVYGEISSYLHNQEQRALWEAFGPMENNVNLARNKILHLENSMLIYGIYNAETLEETIKKMYKNNM